MLGRISLVTTVVLFVGCHDGDKNGSFEDADDAADSTSDTVFVPQDVTDVDTASDTGDTSIFPGDTGDTSDDGETTATTCLTEGGFGCLCSGNADCLDELCIEGPDGNFCTKSCIAECPTNYECLNTSLGGPDPISICVPQHSRLCRPCEVQADCQSPLDPAPAACVQGATAAEGSFCATSCAQDPCPTGYNCEDVPVGASTAKLCRPADGTCECRPTWKDLGFTTSCAVSNDNGTCEGSRECDADGLTACSARVPAACTIDNEFGSCPGVIACDGPAGCVGTAPVAERCNNIDDNCDGQTDETWADCPAGGCFASDTGYVEAGVTACTDGHCVNPNPRPCGNYTCVGGGEEGDTCATRCDDDSTCVATAHCEDNVCVPDTVGGEICSEDNECATGHCQNGFCCETGDCCQQPSDCPASFSAAVACDDAATCQGTRKDAQCNNSMCAMSAAIDDDSACTASTQALDCSPARPRMCTGLADQTAPSCASGCESDGECLDGFHCDTTCVPDVVPGGGCDEDGDCADGVCADGVCCNDRCEGACRACDVAGSLGTCSDVPAGQDPDGECGGVACTGYYFGFEAKTCFLRAPVTAEVAACGAGAACQSDAVVCNAAAKGDVSSTCHATCQQPTANTCTGTTPGACTNITGGPQTCGVGACEVTVDSCEGGAPKACVPGEPTAEICDGIDNDCDGKTDGEDDNLVLANCENQQGVCSGAKHTANLCVGGAWQACGSDIYTANNGAYQPGTETSCETTIVALGLDNDCDGQVDEDFSYTSPAGTVTQGATKPCGVGACANGVTVCGLFGALICSNDFKIGTEVCDGQDNDCDGLNDSLDTNASPLQRVDCENQKGVCKDSKKPNSLCAAGSWQPCEASSYLSNDPAYETTETKCDGLDNDCSGGTADTGLTGPKNPVQLGVCKDTTQKCMGAGGWQDDYPLTYGTDETPSDAFLDENCDGIDGDVDLGLFVTSTGNAGGSCTQQDPCTLARALSIASTAKQQIYVRAGTYTGPFVIPRVVQIYGGYDSNWLRAPRNTNLVTINGGTIVGAGHTAAFRATSIGTSGSPIIIADLVIRGSNATVRTNSVSGGPVKYGASSYGVLSRSSHFSFERIDMFPGSGFSGDVGTAGEDSANAFAAPAGTSGGNANNSAQACGVDREAGGSGGVQACPDSTSTQAGGGGAGGTKDTCCDCVWDACVCTTCNCSATSGFGGGNASVTSGSNGVGGGGGATCNNAGTLGNPGRISDGSGGTAGALNGFLGDNDYWFAFQGNSGTLGANGGGGGGGGGSGGCDSGNDGRGAGGGGGGAGGCRARTAGGGGFGGGGSFGLYGVGGSFKVTGPSTLLLGAGGNGGQGGRGGTGQPGGAGVIGGNGAGGSPSGGTGGNGARGGNSGGGGGGTGGATYAVLIVNGIYSSSGVVTTVPSLPNGAGGGAGGTTGVNGSTGTTGPVANIRQCALSGTSLSSCTSQ